MQENKKASYVLDKQTKYQNKFQNIKKNVQNQMYGKQAQRKLSV